MHAGVPPAHRSRIRLPLANNSFYSGESAAVTVAMAQPTQDTDISSSFTLMKPLKDNELSSSVCNKQLPMEGGIEISIVSPGSDCDIVGENYQNGRHQNSSLNKDELIEEAFPWVVKFTKIMCSSVGSKSYELLERLLLIYTQNVLNSIATCYIKANDAITLKNHVSNTLIFFHFYWHDVKEQIKDHSPYLNKMSVLLGIYVDMELKTSGQNSDPCELAARLLNVLWIYLHNSGEHIFRVLLSIKCTTKRYTKICDPIFTKSFSNLSKYVTCLSDMNYVKFLLAFKLWIRIKEDPRDKKKIHKIALTVLGSHMPQMRDGLLKFMPRPPMGHENETLWLLQPNVFDLRQVREHYLLLEDEINNTIYATNLSDDYQMNPFYEEIELQEPHTPRNQLLRGQFDCSKNDDTTGKTKTVSNMTLLKKGGGFRKRRSVSKIKPGEVILIDLTEESEEKTYFETRKKQRKSKRKSEWLKIIMKKYKSRKNLKSTKYAKGVEIADAHSTKCSENSVDRVLLQYMPISDNKVSESTESCGLPNTDESVRDTQCTDTKNTDNDNQDLRKVVQPDLHDFSVTSLKNDETKYNLILRILKLLKLVGPNIKDPKVILNLMRSRDENLLSHSCFVKENKADTSSNVDITCQDLSHITEDYFTDTSMLQTMCQKCTIKSQYVKEELPTSTGCHTTERLQYCTENALWEPDIINSLNKSHVEQAIKQKLLHNEQDCVNCCTKVDVKPPCIYSNPVDFNVNKPKESTRHIVCDNVLDKKAASDKNLINMLSDLDKCVDVLNRISEHIMSVHVKKQRMDCLNRSSDMCTVSTTVFGDQKTQSSLDYWARDLDSLATDKLNRILELCGKKEFLTACKTKELYEFNAEEAADTKNDVDHGLERLKYQVANVATKTEELYPHENETGSSSQLLPSTRSNPDSADVSEQDENVKSLTSATEELQKHEYRELISNPQVHSTDPCIYESQESDHLQSNEPICISRDQNMSCNTGDDELLNAVCINDFKNVDILDSILNGSLFIEHERDIVEDGQTSLMSHMNHNNSSNVLNYVTEFVAQPESPPAIKREEKLYDVPDTEISTKPLPEGSLGTTGILNLLLDFDLTNMDSPPSDFMYSNVQTVNPHLIENTSSKEMCATAKSTDILDEKIFELSGLQNLESEELIENMSSACQTPLLMHTNPIHSQATDTIKECESLSDFVTGSSRVTCNSIDISTLTTSCSVPQSENNSSPTFNYVPVFPMSFTAQTTATTSTSLMSPCDTVSEVSKCVKPSKAKLKCEKEMYGKYDAPKSSLRVSCRPKSPTKAYALKEFDSEHSQQTSKTSQQKKQILVNFRGKATSNVIFANDSARGNVLRISKEDTFKDTSNVLNRLRSKSNAQLSSMPVARTKRVTEVTSDEITIKPDTRWSMQCVNTQSTRFQKKRTVMRQASSLSATTEESPIKKRKITSKFLPRLEADRMIYSMNQQESQGKHLISSIKDFTCIDGSKHSVGK